MQIRSPIVGAVLTPASAPRFETPSRSKSSPSKFGSPLRGSPGETRFAPHPFKYNGRVAISLIPSVLVLLGAGGTPVIGTLVVGLMISYILDALQFKRGAFIGLWGSLLATAGALAFTGAGVRAHTSAILSALIILTSSHLIFLCGVWGSLQFRWLQIEYPTIVIALERLLFACCPIAASVIQTWGVISAVGIEHGGFYLMAINFLLFWLFVLPRHTSFQSKSRFSAADSAKDALILGDLEISLHCIILVFWPLIFHISIHYVNALNTWVDLYDEILLFFIPFVFLLFASTRGALDWLFKDQKQLHIIRVINGAFAMTVILACIEFRVIFQSFGHYIQLPFPLNYLLVTMALYGLCFGLCAHIMGLIRGKSANLIVTFVLTVSALAGAIAIGMPWKMWFAPAIAAICFAQFYSTGNVQFYFLFMVSSTLSFSWFIVDHFLFLDAMLAGWTLHSICYRFVLFIFLSFLIPFTVMLSKSLYWLTGFVLVAQAISLCNMENHFYNMAHDEDNIYPTYLIVTTSLAGYFVALKLQNENKINKFFSYIVKCLYLSKLSILFLSSPDAILSSAFLLLAITPPIYLYQDKSKGHKMKEWQVLTHVLTIFACFWYCRYTIFDILYLLKGHRPSQSLVLSSLLLLSTLSCSPILFLHFSHSQTGKQLLVLSLSFSLLFLFLQPPFPSFLSFLWNESHMPEEEIDDISIYGMSTSSTWPTWLLLFCLIGGLASAMSALPVFKNSLMRFMYAMAIGLASGLYICLKYFKDAHILYPFLSCACVCICITLIFTHSPPSSSSPFFMNFRFQPWTFTISLLLLPIMYVISRSDDVFTPNENDLPDENEDADYYANMITHESMRSSLLGLYCASLLLIALVAKLKLSSSSFSSSDKEAKSESELPRGSPFTANHRSIKKMQSNSVIRSLTLKKFMGEHTWMISVGNMASLLAFSLALILNSQIKGTEKSIFFIAPILLLLNEDSTFSSSFTDRQRYFPVTFSISIYLFLASMHYLWTEVKASWFGMEDLKFDLDSSSVSFLVKNGVFLILTLPNHVLFNAFMWDYSKVAVGVLLFVTPFNLVSAILSDVSPIKLLSFLSIAFSIAQYLITRNLKIAGLKYI